MSSINPKKEQENRNMRLSQKLEPWLAWWSEAKTEANQRPVQPKVTVNGGERKGENKNSQGVSNYRCISKMTKDREEEH